MNKTEIFREAGVEYCSDMDELCVCPNSDEVYLAYNNDVNY
jgi:hypothetical protein